MVTEPLWTEVLAPGRYRLANGRVVEYTPEDIANAERKGNAMLRAGLSVPLCWEHDPRATPAYLSDLHQNAWLARGYFGKAAEFKRSADGRLFVRPVIADDDDRKQFLRIGKVSPRLDWDWTDETGKKWSGLTVGHVAATPKPVQRNQQKVDPAYSPQFLSHAAGRSRRTDYLSLATRIEGNMADEIETEAPAGGDEVSRIVKALRVAGLMIPEGTTDLAHLAIAVETAVNTRHGEPDGDEGDEEGDGLNEEVTNDDAGATGTTAAGMPPAMMSLFAKAANTQAEEIDTRIRRLKSTGRIDSDLENQLRRELKSANLSHLSFDRSGKLKPMKLLTTVEAYEALPAGKFAKGKPGKSGNLSLSAVDRPHLGPKSLAQEVAEEVARTRQARGLDPLPAQ